ncbi:MAG TPA: DUF547 domain-containing protein [Alphaproteobacteria bacterium]|nr:DUF547 domain-containing protein [Alphaproteobacteria bacterium]
MRINLTRRALFVMTLALGVTSAMRSPAARAQDLDQIFAQHNVASTMSIDHTAWADILKAYNISYTDKINRFAYGKVSQSDRAKLEAYLKALQAVKVTGLSRDEQFAFWANLYNALTIKVILDHYPVASIRDITFGLFSFGPWSKKFVTVEGRELSLDDIEHKILRKVYKDARVHYAVNCASIGCPNLALKPFTGASLNAMLDEGARAYVNHPRGVSVAADGSVKASSIYNWFSTDFGNNDKEILGHMIKYAAPALKAKLEAAKDIDSYDYDWAINDAK